MFCPKCGREVIQGDRFCSSCGTALASRQADLEVGSGQEKVVRHILKPWKNEGSSIVLAFLPGLFCILGIGHMYAGRVEKGLVLFFIGVVLYGLTIGGLVLYLGSGEENWLGNVTYSSDWVIMPIISGVLYLTVWIYQIFDAAKVCREYNSWLIKAT